VIKNGYSALHCAIIKNKEDPSFCLIVKYLIEHKADINSKNMEGDTPLHKASYYNKKEIANVLINNNAELNSLNNLKQTPLDKARNQEMKQWLIQLGAKNNSKDNVAPEGVDANDHDVLIQQQQDGINNNQDLNNNKNHQEMIKKMQMKNEVKEWLKTLSLSEYYDNFINNGYDRMDIITDLNEQDLEKLNIKIGHVKIILKSIMEINNNKQNNDSHDNDQNNDQPGNINQNLVEQNIVEN